MGDHGTQLISKSDLDERPPQNRNIVDVGAKGSVWSVQVDASPERVFWLGQRRNGLYPVEFSDFSGESRGAFEIKGLRRLALDSERNRIVYETGASGIYSLNSIEYDEAGLVGESEVLVSSTRTFSSLSVNPDACGKIFWVDRNTPESFATLKEFDIETGVERSLATSETAPFLWKHVFLAFDPREGHVYWSQNLTGSADDLIGRANYADGTDSVRWISNEPNRERVASYPAQIVIDYRNRDLYWADMNMDWVATAKMTGATLDERDPRLVSRFPLLTGGPASHPTTLAFSRGKLGWMPGTRKDLKPIGKPVRISSRAVTGDSYDPQPSPPDLPYPWE